ncbi:MAG: hypothetical protein WBG33_01190, partial [Rhodanobacter sp.]
VAASTWPAQASPPNNSSFFNIRWPRHVQHRPQDACDNAAFSHGAWAALPNCGETARTMVQ